MCAPCKTNAALGLQIDWRPLLPQIGIRCLNVIGCKTGVFLTGRHQGCVSIGAKLCKGVILSNHPKVCSGCEGWPSAGTAHLADVYA